MRVGHPVRGAHLLFGEVRRCCVTHEDLAGLGGILQRQHARGRSPGEDRAEVIVAGEDDLVCARVHAHRHPQLRPRCGEVDVADRGEDSVHVPRCVHGVLGVIGAGEQDEQRVTGELQHVAAVVGDRQQHSEDAGEGGDELFRALAPGGGELLRERGEARDVDDDGRPVDAQMALRFVGDPVEKARAQCRGRDERVQRGPPLRHRCFGGRANGGSAGTTVWPPRGEPGV